MRYLIALLLVFVSVGSVSSQAGDPEFADAVDWMYTNNLTRYSNVNSFNPNAWLTREQAAKFYVEFNNQQDNDLEKMEQLSIDSCFFVDQNTGDPTLSSYLTQSCQQGLFK